MNYIGAVGKASALKLALNHLIAMHAVGMSLSLGIVQKNNIDVDVFMRILKSSALYAPMFEKKLPNWLDREYENPNFSTKHLLKDVELIKQHVQKLGLSDEVVQAVKTIIEETVREGLCG